MAEKQVTIPLHGMWSVTVDAAGGSASVTYDPVVLEESDLAAVVLAAGH